MVLPDNGSVDNDYDEDEFLSLSGLTLTTSSHLKLMFLYQHPIENDEPDTKKPVCIECKAFSTTSPDMWTPFLLKFTSDAVFKEERKRNPHLSFPRSRFITLKNILMISPLGKSSKPVPNRTMKMRRSDITAALTRSFNKCNFDAKKWYITTALRLVVGESNTWYHNITFPVVKSIIDNYHQMIGGHDIQQTLDDFEEENSVANKGTSDHHTKQIHRVYKDAVEKHLESLLSLTTEYGGVVKRVFDSLTGTYKTFNQRVDAVTSNTVTFANLLYHDMIKQRYPSVLEIIHEENTAERDDVLLQKYISELKTINDSGCEHIKTFLKQTVEFEPFDSIRHKGYVFTNQDKSACVIERGTTEEESIGNIYKKIVHSDLFPHSFSKKIKGTNIFSTVQLCNSNNACLMTGQPVKDILQKKGIMVNIPILCSIEPEEMTVHKKLYQPIYRFCILKDPVGLDMPYLKNAPNLEIQLHVQNPSMQTFSKYAEKYIKTALVSKTKKEKTIIPRRALNEIIAPNFPIYTLSIDIDDPELVNAFYNNTEQNTWNVRSRLIRSMTDLMNTYLSLFHSHLPKQNKTTCCGFESIPDNNVHKKVGLRLLFRFSHLIFKNSKVVQNFIKGYIYFVSKQEKSVGSSIDTAIYGSKCHQLRLTHMAKKLYVPKDQLYKKTKMSVLHMSRPLLPLFIQKDASMLCPSFSLVHKEHRGFCRDDGAVVLTEIGNIDELVSKYSPQDAEFNLLRQRSLKREKKRGSFQEDSMIYSSPDIMSGIDDKYLAKDYSSYFNSILHSILLPTIYGFGGGVVLKDFLYFSRRSPTQYILYPSIPWCVKRGHQRPYQNKCRYTINILSATHEFVLNSYCFGCNCGSSIEIYKDVLPNI